MLANLAIFLVSISQKKVVFNQVKLLNVDENRFSVLVHTHSSNCLVG